MTCRKVGGSVSSNGQGEPLNLYVYLIILRNWTNWIINSKMKFKEMEKFNKR